MKQRGFFDVYDRLKRVSELGDPLEGMMAIIDFEGFRPILDEALKRSDGARGGRPAFDPVMMFKILILQALNDLSDERAEFLITDRLSFMRFLGLSLGDKAPDRNTIWTFREALKKAGVIDALFAAFDAQITLSGYRATHGQIVDASLIAALPAPPDAPPAAGEHESSEQVGVDIEAVEARHVARGIDAVKQGHLSLRIVLMPTL